MRRLAYSLNHGRDVISRVVVRLADVNGPRGGVDKCCGIEVRLKGAYIIRCDEVVKDSDGNVTELRCSYDPETRSGGANSGRKVKGTLHWVSARHAVRAEVRLYDNLFNVENPGAVDDFASVINPDSLAVLNGALVENSVGAMVAGTRVQFMRQGYYFLESHSPDGSPIFNRIVGLKDTWSKMQRS